MRPLGTTALSVSALAALLAGPTRAEPVPGAPLVPPPDGGASAPAALVIVESLYRPGERPRAEGAVVASVEDETLARWNIGGTVNPNHAANREGFHVAPRVFVETRVVSGGLPSRSKRKNVLSKAAVLAQARNRGYWPFRLCYEEKLREDAIARGKVTVRFSIGKNGRVTAARALTSDRAVANVTACLTDKARSLRFVPGPPRRSDVDVSIDLSPGDAPLPDPRRAAPGPTLGALAPPPLENVAPAFEATRAAVETCFARARTEDPGLWGRLSLSVDVAADGRVRRAEELDSRFPAPRVVACARASLMATRLEVSAPLPLVWALRLGAPPSGEAENVHPASSTNSTVADSVPARLRLGP